MEPKILSLDLEERSEIIIQEQPSDLPVPELELNHENGPLGHRVVHLSRVEEEIMIEEPEPHSSRKSEPEIPEPSPSASPMSHHSVKFEDKWVNSTPKQSSQKSLLPPPPPEELIKMATDFNVQIRSIPKLAPDRSNSTHRHITIESKIQTISSEEDRPNSTRLDPNRMLPFPGQEISKKSL